MKSIIIEVLSVNGIATDATAEQLQEIISRVENAITSDQANANRKGETKASTTAPKASVIKAGKAQEVGWSLRTSQKFIAGTTPALLLVSIIGWYADGIKRGYTDAKAPTLPLTVKTWLERIAQRVMTPSNTPETPKA